MGIYEVYGKKIFWSFKGGLTLLLQFNPIFHFMLRIPAIFCNPAYFSEIPPPLFSEGDCTGCFLVSSHASRTIWAGRYCLEIWQHKGRLWSAFYMEFLGDVGFPLSLKMLQNISLRECELLISIPNFFAPMSQSSSTLELFVDQSSFHLEPASPMFEIDRFCAKLLSWIGSVLLCLSLNPFSHW